MQQQWTSMDDDADAKIAPSKEVMNYSTDIFASLELIVSNEHQLNNGIMA